MNAFDRIEREMNEREDLRDIARMERRAIQREKMLNAAIIDAYEQCDRTADCCDLNGGLV